MTDLIASTTWTALRLATTFDGAGTTLWAVRTARVSVNSPSSFRRPWDIAIPARTCSVCRTGSLAVEWRDFAGNVGDGTVAFCGTSDSGLYWFFSPQNVEMLVKVLNGCTLNDRYWNDLYEVRPGNPFTLI